jgi:DnaJ-class molecular chaperone
MWSRDDYTKPCRCCDGKGIEYGTRNDDCHKCEGHGVVPYGEVGCIHEDETN